jgi:hypothetical protein
MDNFACGLADKVVIMADFTNNNRFTNPSEASEASNASNDFDNAFDGLTADNDLLMEQILENMNNTPIGQVLKKIASLPDVRRQKVLRVRRQLTEGRYELNERLDLALEKVLDDLDE